MFTFPDHAPFDSTTRSALSPLLAGMDSSQRAWLSGFLASAATPAVSGVDTAAEELMVLYGTESGNCEILADRALKAARGLGFRARMRNMSDVKLDELSGMKRLWVIVSTWGDGEPPETSAGFYRDLMTRDVSLAGVSYSICALGDTSYEKFCQTGKDIDKRLEELGASRVLDRQDCDVDFDEPFGQWLGQALAIWSPQRVSAQAVVDVSPKTAYGKKNPYPAELVESVYLNGEGSAKETLHLEFDIDGAGMSYEPGDVLAVFPHNAPDVVEDLLKASRLQGDEMVQVKNAGEKPLAKALRENYDITALSRSVLTKLQEATGSEDLRRLLTDEAKDELKAYMAGREILDAIHDFVPSGLSADALAGIFRKLPPRLYSIASSPLAHPGQVHLTVAAVRYQSHGRERKGVCSTYLADRVQVGDRVPVFIQQNKNFRLPADGETPIIMVGPGTGIAPFRAFVEHRAALGCKGKNWLFMGDQRYLYDFLYQLEWQDHLKSGILNRLDVAFSRDQPEKVYVQHRLLEQGAEIYEWLKNGACLYVCGDAARMAVDVNDALVSIIQTHGQMDRDAALEQIEELKKAKRYQRDVY